MAGLEHLIQGKIRVALSKAGCTVFRANVGKVMTNEGRMFDTGLPNGFTDVFGFRHKDGRIFFIEIKSPTGVVRADQTLFMEAMKKQGAIVGIARSVEDALRIVND